MIPFEKNRPGKTLFKLDQFRDNLLTLGATVDVISEKNDPIQCWIGIDLCQKPLERIMASMDIADNVDFFHEKKKPSSRF